jgi:hypothetical protein
MISLGILLKGNAARIIAVSGTREAHELVKTRVHKLELPNNPTKDDVEAFVQAFRAFCMDNSVDVVAINRRPTTGQGAGGAATFRTEGVLLATSPCPVSFFHASTIAATDRRQKQAKSKRPDTQDLGKAYDLAFEGLP